MNHKKINSDRPLIKIKNIIGTILKKKIILLPIIFFLFFTVIYILSRVLVNVPTDLTVSTRSESKIFLTWKDNSNNETGFIIERREVEKDNGSDWEELPVDIDRNKRYFLDEGLERNKTYGYRVRAKCGILSSRSTHDKYATTNSIAPITKHSSGLEVDNQGGYAGGLSHFDILGFDQLYDGHLQIWIEGNPRIYDGDDTEIPDFISMTPISLYLSSEEVDYEHTATSCNPCDPVIFRLIDETIEVHQFTYQKKDENWILIEWRIKNTGTVSRKVKLAFLLDADAGGELSTKDYGNYLNTETQKMIYLHNSSTGGERYIGMALISLSYFERLQISSFKDNRTPDNSNESGNGETARIQLFTDTGDYIRAYSAGPEDLTMTIVSALGELATGQCDTIFYAIAAGSSLIELQDMITDATLFVQNEYDNFWEHFECEEEE